MVYFIILNLSASAKVRNFVCKVPLFRVIRPIVNVLVKKSQKVVQALILHEAFYSF